MEKVVSGKKKLRGEIVSKFIHSHGVSRGIEYFFFTKGRAEIGKSKFPQSQHVPATACPVELLS